MPTTIYAVAGQKFYIGNAAVDLPDDDLEESDFSGVTWIEVKNWSQAGAIGDAAALITTPLIDKQRDVKQKGTRNAGSMQNNFALARSDAGQQAMIAAEATDLNYPFRVVGNDEPAVGTAPAPSERMFYGLVTQAQEAGGAANTAQMLNTTIEVNTNIVIINPTAGAAPVNSVLPAISGLLEVGETLTVYPGVWTGGVDSYTYVWKNEGVAIGGATAATYVLQAGDTGDNITVTVTATNAAGSTAATSPATDVIAA
jgi:hypothetical protein